jgi:phage terminase large subunit GpA-like protein
LIKHLTAEVWTAKGWAKKRPDNHLLDCAVYAWAQAVIAINKPAAPQRQYGKIKSL